MRSSIFLPTLAALAAAASLLACGTSATTSNPTDPPGGPPSGTNPGPAGSPTDGEHCGTTASDCLGGACVDGKCQPRRIATLSTEAVPELLTASGDSLYWVEKSDVVAAAKRTSAPARTLATSAKTSLGELYSHFVQLAVFGPDLFVYSSTCCTGPNVAAIDRSTGMVRVSGGASGADAIDAVRPFGDRIFAVGTFQSFLTSPSNDGERTYVDENNDPSNGSLASNSTMLFYVPSTLKEVRAAAQEGNETGATRRAHSVVFRLPPAGKFISHLTADDDQLIVVASTPSIDRVDLASGQSESIEAASETVLYAQLSRGKLYLVTTSGPAVPTTDDDSPGKLVERDPKSGHETVLATFETRPRSFAVDDAGFYVGTRHEVWLLGR